MAGLAIIIEPFAEGAERALVPARRDDGEGPTAPLVARRPTRSVTC